MRGIQEKQRMDNHQCTRSNQVTFPKVPFGQLAGLSHRSTMSGGWIFITYLYDHTAYGGSFSVEVLYSRKYRSPLSHAYSHMHISLNYKHSHNVNMHGQASDQLQWNRTRCDHENCPLYRGALYLEARKYWHWIETSVLYKELSFIQCPFKWGFTVLRWMMTWWHLQWDLTNLNTLGPRGVQISESSVYWKTTF